MDNHAEVFREHDERCITIENKGMIYFCTLQAQVWVLIVILKNCNRYHMATTCVVISGLVVNIHMEQEFRCHGHMSPHTLGVSESPQPLLIPCHLACWNILQCLQSAFPPPDKASQERREQNELALRTRCCLHKHQEGKQNEQPGHMAVSWQRPEMSSTRTTRNILKCFRHMCFGEKTEVFHNKSRTKWTGSAE